MPYTYDDRYKKNEDKLLGHKGDNSMKRFFHDPRRDPAMESKVIISGSDVINDPIIETSGMKGDITAIETTGMKHSMKEDDG